MCVLVMTIGRLGIRSSVLTLILQILSGAVFYAAALYLAKDSMLKEVLELGKTYAGKVLGFQKTH